MDHYLSGFCFSISAYQAAVLSRQETAFLLHSSAHQIYLALMLDFLQKINFCLAEVTISLKKCILLFLPLGIAPFQVYVLKSSQCFLFNFCFKITTLKIFIVRADISCRALRTVQWLFLLG